MKLFATACAALFIVACNDSISKDAESANVDCSKIVAGSETPADCIGKPKNEQPNVEEEKEETFDIAQVLGTVDAAVKRFERMAVAGGSVVSVKSWMEPTYIWARLTFTDPSAQANPQYLFLACHSHGSELGCHKKLEPGALEPDPEGKVVTPTTPKEEPVELPPIEEELPPIEEIF